ncbi:ChaN family lipoprotein [Lyngbya confervoides]|uniref:ChaN family lipoprotein n=1 Tax=Lyngbya confervoides BDU141951 TaxID=1574623 RepID=A0ABD4T2G7_9CYAN|nr:ChaN family lipoprotein [Lyngbya confervoides]MCM1982618.1 ChaN family lipoprotein [Lyngbya confervoides BDU141951]
MAIAVVAVFLMLWAGFGPAWAMSPDPEELQTWSQANVLYLAENHDQIADHQSQMQILEQLPAHRVTLAMEMFQRPYQADLDAYLTGDLDETMLKTRTEFEQRWGYDWEFYAPLLRFAQHHHIRVLALNTPLEVTRKVGSQGLAGLDRADFQWIPPIEDVDLDHPDYRDRLRYFYDTYHADQASHEGFDYFYQAQVLWDETMAEAIAAQVNTHPDQLVVVLVGAAHVFNEYGIPERVARRIQIPHFQQYSVRLTPPERIP